MERIAVAGEDGINRNTRDGGDGRGIGRLMIGVYGGMAVRAELSHGILSARKGEGRDDKSWRLKFPKFRISFGRNLSKSLIYYQR